MIDPDVLDALVASGCTAEQIASAVKAACASADKAKAARREKDRIRKKITRAAAKGECPDLSAMSGGQRGNPRTDAESTDNVDVVSLSPVPLLPPTPPNNPLTPNPIPKNSSARGFRLPEDWVLNGPDLAFALSKGFSEPQTAEIFEKFTNYWWSATGTKATKKNWHQAWKVWVLNTKPVARAGPSAFAKPLTESQRKQQETNGVRAKLRAFANGGTGSGTPDRVLPLDQREQSGGVCGGSDAGVLSLPGAPGGGGH